MFDFEVVLLKSIDGCMRFSSRNLSSTFHTVDQFLSFLFLSF